MFIQSQPFYYARASGLPEGIGSIVLTSDLQGRERERQNRLLGEVVAEELGLLADLVDIPPIDLAILAGDLYEYPDCHKRSGSGEVSSVWQAFAGISQVLGVHGNHDVLSAPRELPRHARVLDGDILKMNQLVIGGVGGIIVTPNEPSENLRITFSRTSKQ